MEHSDVHEKAWTPSDIAGTEPPKSGCGRGMAGMTQGNNQGPCDCMYECMGVCYLILGLVECGITQTRPMVSKWSNSKEVVGSIPERDV